MKHATLIICTLFLSACSTTQDITSISTREINSAETTKLKNKTIPIDFYIFSKNEIDLSNINEGINAFNKTIQENCSIQSILETKNVNYINENDQIKYREYSSGNDNFRFYQEDLIRIKDKYNIPNSKNNLTFILFNKLENHCSFAIPEVQTSEIKSKVFADKLRNTVLFDYGNISTSECHNSSRIIAHELAHIFVQDNPPHTCPNDYTDSAKCDDDNLILDFKTPTKSSLNKNYDFNDEEIFYPANGFALSDKQCNSIRKTLLSL